MGVGFLPQPYFRQVLSYRSMFPATDYTDQVKCILIVEDGRALSGSVANWLRFVGYPLVASIESIGKPVIYTLLRFIELTPKEKLSYRGLMKSLTD